MDQPERRSDFNLFQQLCTKFDQHVERFERHEAEEVERSKKLYEAQQKNTDAIKELTISVASVVEGTSSLVQLTKDVQGAARVGKGVQGFLLWCLKWGVITTGIYHGVDWVVEYFIRKS
jgi:hypothetical protein